MVSIYDVDASELIERAAQELQKDKGFEAPSWAAFVKTGASKQRTPSRRDWWHIRVAAILRSIYRLGPVGVSKLRTKYGGKLNRGVAPEHFLKGSGSIIRKAIQQLEKAGFVKQTDAKGHKGRIVTPKGKSFLDKIAMQLYKPAAPKVEHKPEEIKIETKTETKAETKPEVKAEHKMEIKAEVKAAVKTEPNVEIKAETKPEVKAEHKAEIKAASPSSTEVKS